MFRKSGYLLLAVWALSGCDPDFSVARRYGLKAVPTVFLVKPDTQIHYTELYNPRIDDNIAAYFEQGGDVKPAPHKPAGGVFG